MACNGPLVQGGKPVGVERQPAGGEETGIADPLVGPAALPRQIRESIGRERNVEFFAEPGVERALEEWSGVGDVEDFLQPRGGGGGAAFIRWKVQ